MRARAKAPGSADSSKFLSTFKLWFLRSHYQPVHQHENTLNERHIYVLRDHIAHIAVNTFFDDFAISNRKKSCRYYLDNQCHCGECGSCEWDACATFGSRWQWSHKPENRQIPFPAFCLFHCKNLNFFIFRYEKSGEQSAFFLRLIDALNFFHSL